MEGTRGRTDAGEPFPCLCDLEVWGPPLVAIASPRSPGTVRRMTSVREHEVFDDIAQGVIGRVSKSMAVLFSDGDRNQFSGIFFRNGSDRFVVTAGHAVRAVKNWNSLRIASKERPASSKPPGRISVCRMRRSRSHRDITDIALIALTPEFADSVGALWFDDESIDSSALRPGSLVFAMGIFAQHTRLHPLSGQVHVYKPAAYATVVSPRSPGLLDPKADPRVDIFLEFDPENTLLEDPTGVPLSDGQVHPSGLSGAGVFLAPGFPDDGSMWSPTEVKLVAIQSGFLPDRLLLRAKRAEHIRQWIAEYRRTRPVNLDPSRCGAIGISGKQCKRALRAGKRLCWQHRG